MAQSTTETASTRRRVGRVWTTVAAAGLLVAGLVAGAPAASADTPYNHPMPPGHWTLVRQDAFIHYACKVPMSGAFGPVYRIHTRTWYNGERWAMDSGMGVSVVTTRFSDSNIIDVTTSHGWLYGYSGSEVWASAYYSDRLWIQGAYYGPSAPWTHGKPVKDLVNC